ncbi:MAG: inorganic diphosphatase [Bacilli bacterium]|nr:inorganic diphosphatase [Bacilli bacterium]
MNILHAVRESKITPEHFLACIEIPMGTSAKYELDHETGALTLDRVLFTATHYPQNYGFIPKTWGLDDDPLDVLVITSIPVVPLSLVRAYPVGVLSMTDSGKVDEKIIAICENDPVYNSFKDIKELPQHILQEISHFFTVYKQLETGKHTEIGDIHGASKAKDIIRQAKSRYAKKFG